MVKRNTLLRHLCVLLVATSVVLPASAQSVFHFPRVVAGGPEASHFTISNPSGSAAEVQFELFGLDGSLAPAPAQSGALPCRARQHPLHGSRHGFCHLGCDRMDSCEQ